jgi:hypothetical protein
MLVIVPKLLVIAVIVNLGLCGFARAEPTQQFTFQVASPRPGNLAVHVKLRRFDTNGVVPQTPTALVLRLPRGVNLNPAFLTSRYLCNGRALRDALDAHPSGMPFAQRLEHLGAFVRELQRSGTKGDRAKLPNVLACLRGRIGGGTGLIDARDVLPFLTDPIPVGFSLFLSRGTVPGAVASFATLGAADARSAVARKYPVVAGVHAAMTENLIPDPTPDGLYGLKLAIYTGPINGFQVSIAEVDVKVRALELRRGACLATGRGDRCARRQRTNQSLFSVPTCPPAGHYSAQLLSTYAPPTPGGTTTQEVPCPRYAS